MSRICYICGVGPMAGRTIKRKGLLKKKGGTGSKTTRTNKRVFLPNLQKIRIIINNAPRTARVCTKCIKAGKIKKA
ncbi:50S ribosomal protein L28 [Candidatus Omnitrophota bacterium]